MELFKHANATSGALTCQPDLNDTIMNYNEHVLFALVFIVFVLCVVFAVFIKKHKIWCYEDEAEPGKQTNRGMFIVMFLRVYVNLKFR